MSDVQDREDYRGVEPAEWSRPPGPWGRPPTGAWPPCPPRPGPWPGGLFRLSQCWDDVKATRAILRKMIADIIAEDPSLIGLAQPIIGVTDGSDAQPGQVGEFIRFDTQLDYAANTGFGGTRILGVLVPGDWDVWIYGNTNTYVQAASFYIDPVPPGFSGNLWANMSLNPGQAEAVSPVSPVERALTSAPSLIAVAIGGFGGPTPGTMTVTFSARRRR